MKKTIYFVIAIFAIVSCSTNKKVVETPKEVVTTETTMAQIIENGKNLFEARCGNCHDLPNPKAFSAQEWKPIMLSMQGKAKISDGEREEVYKYLTMK